MYVMWVGGGSRGGCGGEYGGDVQVGVRMDEGVQGWVMVAGNSNKEGE